MTPLLAGIPFSGGGIGKASVTSTTGSPTVDTTSRSGKTIYKFTGTGSITIGTSGTAEVLVVGGGGASRPNGGGGAGAGGYLYKASYFIPAGTYTVKVGAGGAGVPYNTNGPNNTGEDSYFLDLLALGGSGASNFEGYGGWSLRGGSGGGGTYNMAYGLGTTGQGNRGGNGNGSTYYPGGGGGAGAVGGDGTSTNGIGGVGLANSITGTSITYATGGTAAYGGMVGAVNKGEGGGGRSPSTGPELCNGGSGIVVVVTG